MFTVLIAEKEHIDAIRQENKLFFEPFLDSKDFAFCYWNPAGQNLSDSVPGLLDAVNHHKDWRAVIINNCNIASSDSRNPFDIVDHSALDALLAPSQRPDEDESREKWESDWNAYYEKLSAEKEIVYRNALQLPLQKLTTWLCFKPENFIFDDIQEKQDADDWAMNMLGRDEMKFSAKLEEMEKEQYKYELRLKETLRREFLNGQFLNIEYPSGVYCISLRSIENQCFDPGDYWNMGPERQYSSFADRNMYFDSMRFMVYDILSPSHCRFRSDYIRFLASVMIFVSNTVPNSALAARRLYQLEVETDDDPLCTLVTSYDKKLSNTFDIIGNEMERIKSEIPGELTDKAAEALFCTPKEVPVLLDESCDFDKIYAEKDYGLFFDTPENEFHKWNRDYETTGKAMAYIVKQQSRSVRKSVAQMHFSSELSDVNVNVNRLTSLQLDDIREFTDSAEDTMIASIPSDLKDMAVYRESMKKASEPVKKEINRRMTRKTGLILGAICLGLFLLCFLPFLFSNHGTWKTVSTAVIMCGVSLGILAIILAVALLVMRQTLLRTVKDYNNTVHEILNDIHLSLQQVSKYLSSSCIVRRGHSVQKSAQKNLDEYTKSLRIRKKHQEDIRRIRAELKENYSDYLVDNSFCDEAMSRPYDYDFDQKKEYAYPAPFLAGDQRQIEFISIGNRVTVPSSYVTRIIAKMEGIYDK